MDVDDNYEYNAPQFVDFEALKAGGPEDENVDDYFNFDHENGAAPVDISSFGDSSVYEDAGSRPVTRQNTPKSGTKKDTRRNPKSCRSTPPGKPSPALDKENIVSQASKKLTTLKQATKDMPTMKAALNNICTDLSAWRSRSAAAKSAPSNNTLKAKRKSLHKTDGMSTRRSLEDKRPQQSSPTKIHKRSNSVQSNKIINKVCPSETTHKRRTRSQTNSTDTSKSNAPKDARTESVDNKYNGTHKKHKRTASVDNKSSTLRRVASLENLKMFQGRGRATSVEEHKQNRSVNQSSAKKQHKRTASANALPVKTRRSVGKVALKPKLTIPNTPSFMRRKTNTVENVKTAEQLELEKIAEYRKELVRSRKKAEESHNNNKLQTTTRYIPVPVHSSTQPTKPVGFQFATDERIKEHPMETRQDPKDFKQILRNDSYSKDAQNKPLHPTKVQPFHFHDHKRKTAEGENLHNVDGYKSMAEKVMAFARKTPDRFRMRPKKVTQVEKPEGPPQLTIAHTPNLLSRKRTRTTNVKSHQEIEEEVAEQIKRYKFYAQPVNEEMLKKPCGVKKICPKEVTKPLEFEWETDRRVHYRHDNNISQEDSQVEERVVRAQPVPHQGIPWQPKYDHKTTKMQPFSFEERDRKRFTRKEEKIRKQVEVEIKMASEFRANPLPDLSPRLPERHPAPITEPEPFALEIDQRGVVKAEDWSHKMEEELRQQRAAAKFKARPNAVIHKKPFIPHKSTKPLTGQLQGSFHLGEVELNTERRAEKRAEFESFVNEKQQELELQRRAMEHARDEEERLEAERIRAAAVHKAQPVRKYRHVEVKPSEKPLTDPQTPRFSARLRRV